MLKLGRIKSRKHSDEFPVADGVLLFPTSEAIVSDGDLTVPFDNTFYAIRQNKNRFKALLFVFHMCIVQLFLVDGIVKYFTMPEANALARVHGGGGGVGGAEVLHDDGLVRRAGVGEARALRLLDDAHRLDGAAARVEGPALDALLEVLQARAGLDVIERVEIIDDLSTRRIPR